MSRFLFSVSSLFILLTTVVTNAHASDTIDYAEKFFRAKVVQVDGVGERDVFGRTEHYQKLRVALTEDPHKDELLKVEYVPPVVRGAPQFLTAEDQVVMARTELDGEVTYDVYEPYRLPALFLLTIGFVVVAVLVAGFKGLSSLIGLAATLVILIKWIIPGIVSGLNPLAVSFGGAVLIATISLYLSHGFKKRTSIALLSTLITLAISLGLALLAVQFTSLFGMGTEDALYLTSFGAIDLRGLLLGAIVIGTLGVLDDVTTTQVATVEELHKANSKFHFKDLYAGGLSVGKEHIVSMINTLVIAYVGASFPVFLLITKSPQPLWVILNNEFLAEEIVRTLVGSVTLILAVPIATFLAAYFCAKKAN